MKKGVIAIIVAAIVVIVIVVVVASSGGTPAKEDALDAGRDSVGPPPEVRERVDAAKEKAKERSGRPE